MPNTTSLPETTEELKGLLIDLDAKYRARIEFLEERVRFLQKALFGRKSEKRPPEIEGRRLGLFNEAEVLAEKPAATETLVVPEHTRRTPKRKPLPENLPRLEVVHDLDEEEKVCACGAKLCRIGEEVSEKLDIIPAKIQVIRHIRYKYACKTCQGVEGEGATVKIAPPPLELIPKGLATSGLVAHIAVSKYSDALPLYRQEKIFSRHGIEHTRSTMAGWMVKAAERCEPLMRLLQRELVSGPLVNADETPVQVLDEPGRANTTKSYTWVFRGGAPGKEVVFFRYSPTRSGDVPKEILDGYRGYLQTDAFSAYDGLAGEVRLVGCFAHARRNFVKVIEARGKGSQKKGSAEVALDYIRKLYNIERVARSQGFSPPELRDFRKERAEDVLGEFKSWMDERVRPTPPKGLLGKALNHALNHWPKLIRYVEDGHITPDNNAVENAIRPFVVGRKNWLFAGHPNGAHASATLFSLIETAKSCGLEPYRYLRFLFDKLPGAQTLEDHEALLPQRLLPHCLALASPYM
jgi:transposase